MLRTILLSISICCLVTIGSTGQDLPFEELKFNSVYLNEEREVWVHLPYGYLDTLKEGYNVIYVLDAEWRFDVVRNIVFDFGANGLMPNSIVVGIPHVEMNDKRGKDLTFSHSRTEYDGEEVDSTWYNSSNSGGGSHFYNYLSKELIPFIDQNYNTNKQDMLIGHSYGGYFASYIVNLENNPFEMLQVYDPSIWFGAGEVNEKIKQTNITKQVSVFVTYQPEPKFHKEKIEEMLKLMKKEKKVELGNRRFSKLSHNALFLFSLMEGLKWQFEIPSDQ